MLNIPSKQTADESKRRSFALRYAAFWRVKDGLSRRDLPPFAMGPAQGLPQAHERTAQKTPQTAMKAACGCYIDIWVNKSYRYFDEA